MKIIKRIIYLSLMLLFTPIIVSASTTGNLTCDKTNVKTGEILTCELTASGEELTDISGTILYSGSYLTLNSIKGLNGWDSSSNSLLELSKSTPTTLSNTKVAKITFTVKGSPEYGSSSVSVAGDISASFSFRVLSPINQIKALSIEGFSFKFDPKINNYNIKLNKESIIIRASLMDSNSKFKDGYAPRKVSLDYGNNEIKLIVVSETGVENVYTLTITRPDTRNTSNNLSSLSLSTGTLSPKFDSGTLTYEVNLKESVSSVTISAKLANEKASFEEKLGPRTVKLNVGTNSVPITVKAQNGDLKTYTININRGVTTSNNTYLKSLSIEGVNIDFNKETTKYDVKVLNDVEKLKIDAIAESDTSKVVIEGNDLLKEGKNTITITITSESGLERKITLIVTKLKEGETLSNNTYLKSLVIKGYNIDFKKTILNYEINIKNDTRLYITATPENQTSTVRISGNLNLKDGSIIKVIVTSEDTSEKVYTINIVKDSTGLYFILAISLSVILIISMIAVALYKKNKKKKSYEDDLTLNKSSNERVVISNKKEPVDPLLKEDEK